MVWFPKTYFLAFFDSWCKKNVSWLPTSCIIELTKSAKNSAPKSIKIYDPWIELLTSCALQILFTSWSGEFDEIIRIPVASAPIFTVNWGCILVGRFCWHHFVGRRNASVNKFSLTCYSVNPFFNYKITIAIEVPHPRGVCHRYPTKFFK